MIYPSNRKVELFISSNIVKSKLAIVAFIMVNTESNSPSNYFNSCKKIILPIRANMKIKIIDNTK